MRYPSLLRRYVASLIDGSILCLAFALYMREPLHFANSQAINYWPLLLLPLYEALLTRYLCTPGQLLMNIRVRTEPEIERVPVWRTFYRLFVKYLLGILSFVFMPAHPQKRALHDLAAETIVIDARSVAERRNTYLERLLTASPSLESGHEHFPSWLLAGLVMPLPTIIVSVLVLGWAALPRTSPVLRALVFATLSLGVLSLVALPIAAGRIAKKQTKLSPRTAAQMLPAFLVSLAFVILIGFLLSHGPIPR
jgi:uncharacterized RDD family membrane protein YckC